MEQQEYAERNAALARRAEAIARMGEETEQIGTATLSELHVRAASRGRAAQPQNPVSR